MGISNRTLTLIIIGVAALALFHSVFHFSTYGTGIDGLAKSGISGLAINNDNSGSFLASSKGKTLSSFFVFLEWAAIFLGLIGMYAKYRVELKKEIKDLSARKLTEPQGQDTDIDRLYKFLQEKKHLRLATIAKVFEVDEEVVENWAKTLEAGGLAVLTYPRVGGPELVLKEKVAGDKKGDKKNKK